MKIQKLIPTLYTTELKSSVDFYTKNLGFKCDAFAEEWGWAHLWRDEAEIMFALPNAHEPFDKPTFTGSIYLKTDDVDKIWLKLKDAAKICYPIENFDYGMREFAVYDNNGYMIQFGQEITH